MKTNLTPRLSPRSPQCRLGFALTLLLAALTGLAAPADAGSGGGVSLRRGPDSPHLPIAGSAALAILSSDDQLPPWAVGFGKEFWRRSTSSASTTSAPPVRTTTTQSKELPASIDLGDLMDRVTHAFRGEDSGEAKINGSRYQASIGPSGLAFSPLAPSSAEDVALATTPAFAEAILRTRKVSTADRVVYATGGAGKRVILGNTVQTLLDPSSGLVEHFEGNADGIAVSWILARPPSSGDLTVELEIAGLTFTDKTELGHHFADSSGVSRLRVGHATLVDSSGVKSDLKMHYADNALQITVPADLLARAAYPVAIDPLVSAEFGIDACPVADPLNDYEPRVAHNSGQYLVVWDNLQKIMGVRLSAAGQILDPAGIEICPTVGSNPRWPSVAATSAGYLVVWEDYRNNPPNGSDIYGARVTTSGVVVDPAGIGIATGSEIANLPDVANNGNVSLVVWGGIGHVWGARVRDDGVVLDPAGIQISTGANAQNWPAVACNGSDYVVVWTTLLGNATSGFYNDIYGARVSFAGGVGAQFPISTGVFDKVYPAIAALGADYLAVWEDNRIGPDPDIFGARITAAGVGANFPICTFGGGQKEPAIAANSQNYLVVWHDSRFFTPQKFNIYGTRVSAAGSVQDPGGFMITDRPNRETSPGVAAGANNFLVAWADDRNNSSLSDIFASFISPSATVLQPSDLLISGFSFPQLSPKVAFDGTHFLAVWMDYRKDVTFTGNTNVVFGLRLTATGQPDDPSGLLISQAASLKEGLAVAGNPNQFLVVWGDRRNSPTGVASDIYGCRIAGATVRDPNGIPISTASGLQASPSVATDGTDFFVVWTDDGRGASHQIIGSGIAADGTVTHPAGIALNPTPEAQDFPEVAFGGGNYFVVWQDGRANPGVPGPTDIYATRVNNGTVLDPSGILINASVGPQRAPRVAYNGTQFLVAWEDRRNVTPAIYSSLVAVNGTVLNAAGAALTNPRPETRPAVAAGGSDFLTVWLDNSNPLTTGGDIYGARVKGGTGASLDGLGFGIATSIGVPVGPSVAYGGNNRFLVVYQGLVQNTSRVLARFVTPTPPGTIPGLFNTGVDPGGTPLADDSPDSHYTVSTGGAASPVFAATLAGGFPIPPWLPDNASSAWISPTLSTEAPATSGQVNIYRFETTFDLTGLDPATARIVGEWSTDNEGFDILINGQTTGQANSAQFASFTPFTISTGFVPGLNTLAFIVHNDGVTPNPLGLRVQMTGTVQANPNGTGLLGVYYDNMDFTSPRVARTEAVNFDWGTGAPAPGVDVDSFSVRWAGKVVPRYSDTYRFFTVSDDGVRLWIDGRPIVNEWNDHAPTEHYGDIVLEAGRAYDVVLELYENSGGATAKLLWQSGSQAKEPIPASHLLPTRLECPTPGRPTFTANFNLVLPAGTAIFGQAARDAGWLKLTRPDTAFGILYVNNFSGSQPIHGFEARFTAALFGSTCCGGGSLPADGFSFNLVPAAGVLANPGYNQPGEEGLDTGLAVNFDTWDSGGGEGPAIEVKWLGQVIARQPFQASQSPAGITTAGAAAREVLIHLASDGLLTVSYGGVRVLDNVQTPYTPAIIGTPKWVIGARTGGANDNHWIRDLHIVVNRAKIPELFNTGVDNFDRPLPEDAIDPHYVFSVVGGQPMPSFVATAAGGFPIGPWLPDNTASAWISPTTTTFAPPDFDILYQTTFNLKGLNPAGATIRGWVAADDQVKDILLNGQTTGQASPPGAEPYLTWQAFAITSGIQPGANTLTFVTRNGTGGDNPTGLRVEMCGWATPPSLLHLDVAYGQGGTTISWGSLPHKRYFLEHSPSPSGPWVREPAGGILPGAYQAQVTEFTIHGARDPIRFYRVIEAP